MTTNSLKASLQMLDRKMKLYSKPIHTATWQSIDISKRPEAAMRELTNVTFTASLPTEELDYYRSIINPNLPWADRHFVIERVSGSPINPGTTWKEWPYGNSASNFLEEGEVFSHTYAERYWPKQTDVQGRRCCEGCKCTTQSQIDSCNGVRGMNRGIRYNYGDLDDVVKLLVKDPLTRQAYLPVWFPEDTGVVHGKRVPCSLGYHFWMRNNQLSVFYGIRSCDWMRHARDDVYLTIRLLLWVLQRARAVDTAWKAVKTGELSMWIGNLHLFINDWNAMYGKRP